MKIDCDQATHTYRLDGRVVPSVTQVLGPLNDYSMVPHDVLEAARVFGQHVHEACDLLDRGELDWSALDPSLVPYVEAWSNFLATSGAVVIASEQPVYHAKLGYAGTPDKVLAWGKRKTFVIPDIKSTAIVPPTVGPQTAAYARAYQSMYGGREPARYCIQLREDGTFRTFPRTDPADWTYFLSALNCHKFREQHRVRHPIAA